MRARSRLDARLSIGGPPIGKFAVQSPLAHNAIFEPPSEKLTIQPYSAHIFRLSKTEFITPHRLGADLWADLMAEDSVWRRCRNRRLRVMGPRIVVEI